MGVSVYWPLSVCVCVCVCVIPNVFDLGCMCQTTHQGPSSTKEPRLDMCRLILSVSKIAHQMWCDHAFS